MSLDYYVGVDLGQTTDFTAVALIERPSEWPEDGVVHYALRHLQRFPLKTPYTAIVPAVVQMARSLPGYPVLVVDQTGVGRAVVDLLQSAPLPGRMVPITITAGHQATVLEDGSHHVPKKDLVGCLQVLLESRRLRVARGMPEADTLVREMQDFRVKITAALNETYSAWREGKHDDLVLAVSLACWLAEREPPWPPDAIRAGGGSFIAEAPEGVFLK
jgi:hypothetical protein